MTRLPRVLLASAVLLMLAVWQVPPRLDWGRYRAGIAEMAAARIGRPVNIGGSIHLNLIPQPILTATRVTLADRGDGISANLGALRLQVAFWPLLAGRLVPRDLLLDDPVVTVPWPLPRVTPTGVHTLPLGFGARVEGGTLLLNGFPLENIDADMQADADTGAFAASGTALLAGRPVRFSTLIGAPGADGIATLAVTLDGQDALLGTGGTLRGRLLADGALAGMISARGADLSRLLPGPAAAWRLHGAVAATGGTLHAPQLEVLLGQSPGTAGLTLHLTPTPRAEAGIHIGQVALDSWPWQPTATRSALPMHLDLSADAATWRGAIFRAPHLMASLGANQTVIEAASATLPGGGTLRLAGALHPHANSAIFAGPISLQAPDARALLGAFAPSHAAYWPAAAARPITLQADLRATANTLALARAQASFGAVNLAGSAELSLTARPVLRLTLSLDHATPGDWLPALPARQSLAAMREAVDLTLHLQAADLMLPAITLHRIVLDATADQTRLAVHHLTAELQGGHIEAAGTIGTDGSITDATLDATVAETATLPASWRGLPGLWHGPAHLAASAAGPPHQVAVQLRCDVNDLRAEAEAHLDLQAATLTATATLRHPGAPRLLASLGVADAGSWIGPGSVALIAHLTANPRAIQATDFSLAAGALRVGGSLAADTTTSPPTVTGKMDAPFLTLPAFIADRETPLPLGWLTAWQGSLHLATGPIWLAAAPVADRLSADVTFGAGALLASDITAALAGGAFHGEAAVDATPPAGAAWAGRASIFGANIAANWATPPFTGGSLDLDTTLSATGFSPAAILATLGGEFSGTAHNIAVHGIDLPRVTYLLATRAPHPRRALAAALASGDTGPLTGRFAATLNNGALTLTPTTLTGAAGTLSLSGSLDLPGRSADMALQIRQGAPDMPVLGVRIAGAWQAVRRTVEVGGRK